MLLFGICSLKESPTASVLILLAFCITLVRTSQMASTFAQTAKRMPLQRCEQLDLGGPPESLALRAYELRYERSEAVEELVQGALEAGGRGALDLVLHPAAAAAAAASAAAALIQPLVDATGAPSSRSGPPAAEHVTGGPAQ